MNLKSTILLASAWLFWPALAMAQVVDRGNDVTVNPVAGGGGGRCSIRRAIYARGPSRAAGRRKAGRHGFDYLHMPVKHAAVMRKAPAADTALAAPLPPKPGRGAIATQAGCGAKICAGAESGAARRRYSRPEPAGAAGLNFGAPPTKLAKANPPPAMAAPTGAEAATAGLTKRSVILFAPQAAEPGQSALGAIKFLAGDLNAAMTSASARIQIRPLAAIAATRVRMHGACRSSARWRSARC